MEQTQDCRQDESQGHHDEGESFANISLASFNKFNATRHEDYLNDAVDAAALAVENTPDCHAELPPRMSNLSTMLEARYRLSHDDQDLKNSITWLDKAIDLLDERQPEKQLWLIYSGNSKGDLFDKSGDDECLRSCIDTYRKSSTLPVQDPQLRRDVCYKLSDRLAQRYENSKHDCDLDDAVRFARQLLPENLDFEDMFDPADASYLIRRLGLRYERFGMKDDMDQAIMLATRAADMIPMDDHNWPAYSQNLGLLLEQRYAADHDPEDLRKAIELSRSAINFPSLDLKWRLICASGLGTKLMLLFEQTGDVELAQESIAVGKFANELWLQIFETQNPKTCYNLGTNLARYYQYTGQSESLEEGIKFVDYALKVWPDTSAYIPLVLDSLASMLYLRYEQDGELEDLNRSILTARAALFDVDQGHKDYFEMRLSLSEKLGKRFERSLLLEDLKESMTIDEHDLDLARVNDGSLQWTAKILVSLSHRLRLSFQQSGDITSLKRAISMGEEAITLVKTQNIRIDWLTILANNYGYLYQKSGQAAHLFKAISLSQSALDSSPIEGRSQAMLLNNVAYKYESLYLENENERCLIRACNLFNRAWHSHLSIPFHRVLSASRCLKLLTRLGRHEESVELAQDLTDFMSTFNINTLDYKDRQYVVSTFSGVAAEACASFLELGRGELAVGFLEQGRTMILNDLLQVKTDLSELKTQHPNIANGYEALRSRIVNPKKGDGTDLTRQKLLEQRHSALKEMKSLTRQIQNLEGWSNFMAYPTVEAMKQSIRGGVVAIVNVAQSRSDAILISSSNITIVRLPNMTRKEVKTWTGYRWDGTRAHIPVMNTLYRDYLPWLWNVCVKPVMDVIPELCPHLGETLPRIWWIGVGVASSIPFHAAGDHSKGSMNNTLSHAISSYIPSIKVLARAQQQPSNSDHQPRNLLITTMSKTPGLQDLARVLSEKDKIIDCTRGLVPYVWKDQPSAQFVVESLQDFTAVHFACHGITDKFDPSRSGMVFTGDVSADQAPTAEILTVYSLSSATRRRRAEIAYLSSCSTADNKITQLSDEVIHVASAFQVAGFRHVVACLWTTYDNVCSDVAGEFYRSVFGGTTEVPLDRDVAAALHRAVLRERNLRPRNPLSWAQFVHFGA